MKHLNEKTRPSILTLLCLLCVFCASGAAQGRPESVLFDFDNAPLHSPFPIDLNAGGINAHFSANPAYYNYSIQRADVLGFTPAGFAGYSIYPNTIYLCDLLISFDRPMTDVSILYAPEEYATDSSCTMRITGYFGTTFVATNTFRIQEPGTWPTGTLSLSSAQPFDNVVIHYDAPPPTGGDWGPIFMADNLMVTEAVGPTPTPSPSPSPTLTPTPTPIPTPTPPPGVQFDFDGDRIADISVYRPNEGAWYLLCTQNGFTVTSFGMPTDKIAPADFDGDGKADIAVYRPSNGTWYVVKSSSASMMSVQFGTSEDLPTPADYDGDNKADVSVFRPSSGVWYRLNSSNSSFAAVQFGLQGDQPTLGDFDGDGRADIAVFRLWNGVWYRLNSSNGAFSAVQFGSTGDLITPADFDGDGRTDISVFRPSEGNWYVLRSTAGFMGLRFGLPTDIPAAADLDGDGRADIVVFRPSDGYWYRLNSSSGAFVAQPFGMPGDKPIPSAFRWY